MDSSRVAEIRKLALESLCVYDKRNPYYYERCGDDDTSQVRRIGCSCDSCFYKRDKLAVFILDNLV